MQGLKPGLWRQYVDVRAARRRRGAPRSLPLLSLELTTLCNAHCAMCAFPGDYPAAPAPLRTDEWLAVIDEAAALGTRVISLGGGEPLLHPDVEALIERIDGHGITTLLHTNASRLTAERCARLARFRRLSVAMSLDSHRREQHDALRGLACFDRLLEAARWFVAEAPQVGVSFTFTVTARNWPDMRATMALAAGLGVRAVRYTPLHENLQHRFGQAGERAALRPAEGELPALRAEIEAVLAYARAQRMLTNSPRFLRAIPDYFRGPVAHACQAGFFYASIDPGGRLFPCYDHQGEANVRAGGLAAAWRSEAMDRLRTQVVGCARRCWNVGTAEPSLRLGGGLAMLPQLLREARFYLR